MLTSAEAHDIVELVMAQLGDRGAAVAVTDDHGELLAFRRTDSCPLPSIVIAQNKAYTAARQRTASKSVGEASRLEGFPMTNFGDPRMVTWGGGVPLVRDGVVIGAVGVSGLPESEDVELAVLAAQSIR